MRIVDANVLLYAVNTSLSHHARARSWLDGALAEADTVGFAWPVLLAFLRLATHRAVFERPLTATEAAEIDGRGWLDLRPWWCRRARGTWTSLPACSRTLGRPATS